jgi:hypothetical protein
VTDERLGRAVRWTAILLAAWTVPVFIGVAGHYFGMAMDPRETMPPAHIVGHSLSLWWSWIPATPVVFLLHRRMPFGRGPVAALVALHAAVLGAVFLLQMWLSFTVGHVTGHVAIPYFWPYVRGGVENLLLYDAFIYAGVLAIAFGLDYAKRYRDRDLRASQLETQLERARLVALQSQLQPHFLFNALNSIAMLVRRERKQEALDVVVGFGELLRYVLDEAGTVDVPLAEELRFVRRYLEIESVRHRDRLRVTYDVDAAAERALVPNLVLQPLVENALKHGIAVRPEGGEVRIIVAAKGEALCLMVENDGPRLSEGYVIGDGNGVGLRNLRDRLAAVAGASAELRLESREMPVGVRATVVLPLRPGAGRETDLEARAPGAATMGVAPTASASAGRAG